MMKKYLLHNLIALSPILFSTCGNKLPALQNIDLKMWREDKNACKEIRTHTLNALNNQKDKLLALSENDIVELLGRPDHNELYKRNQKFYYYWLEASDKCLSKKNPEPLKLVIRFNAMGIAKELSIEK